MTKKTNGGSSPSSGSSSGERSRSSSNSKRRGGGASSDASVSAAAPWTLTPAEALRRVGADESAGLTTAEAEARLAKHGPNELDKEEERSFWEMVLEQFDDPLVKILLVAASVSTAIAGWEAYEAGKPLSLDQFVEPLVIILILILNAAIGVYQENSAEQSLEALKDMQPSVCTVLRDGKWHAGFDSKRLVPGDVVKVAAGDSVPADCRVFKLVSTTLRAEQAALTGETVAVLKQAEPVSDANPALELQQRHNYIFSATMIASGTALAVVEQTGMRTEIGKIQDQIKKAEEETREEKTPLKEKLDEFSDQLQWLITGVCVLVWVINVRQFLTYAPGKTIPLELDVRRAIFYFQIAVALAVAAIPEGLPTVITMCLALGTRKMAQRNCIVRQLPAVETLGCTTVICSDKTGTLTTNKMTCRRVVLMGDKPTDALRVINVTGTTYKPRDGKADVVLQAGDDALDHFIEVCSVCNDSDVVYTDASGTDVKHVGAPTEAALKVLVEKLDPIDPADVSKVDGVDQLLPTNAAVSARVSVVAMLEFTRDRKSMSAVVRSSGSSSSGSGSGSKKKAAAPAKNRLLVKGAPESVLERCSHVMYKSGAIQALTPAERKAIATQIADMSRQAWRCLGVAVKDLAGDKLLADYDGTAAHAGHKLLTDPDNFARVESDMVWIGAVGMEDPPRPEVRVAVSDCRRAGIRVIVITGDNQTTAEAIAKKIGVFDEDDEDLSDKSFIGSEFSAFPLAKKRDLLWNPNAPSLVFSRAEPKFKQDIVKILKEGSGDARSSGEIVAMTGDGVNDAPALKMADIGVAMGIAGTEVAKAASDMVLADDNFSTIVAAIEEGRSIYSNMKAFIRYMISSNIGEVASIFFTAALGFPEGMVSVQLLWVNLVTDGPPATALGFNKSEPDVMRRPPRRADDALISRWAMFRFLVIGLYVGVATVGVFATWFTHTEFLGIDLSRDGHRAVTLEMLMNWDECDVKTNKFALPSGTVDFRAPAWTAVGPFGSPAFEDMTDCKYFGDDGKSKASTLSLTVLVVIEMMNACNALSEDSSLLTVTPLSNPYLLLAIFGSVSLHLMILYVPVFNPYFKVVPLDWNEWKLVLIFSLPVVIIDETLKFFARQSGAASSGAAAGEAPAAKRGGGKARAGGKKGQ